MGTRDEFAEDPHDLSANLLLHTVQHLSVDARRFAGPYLPGHGAIELWLVAGLLRERLRYFPVSIVVFALFIAYQAYRFTYTDSVWLLLVTALDVVVIALTGMSTGIFEATAGSSSQVRDGFRCFATRAHI